LLFNHNSTSSIAIQLLLRICGIVRALTTLGLVLYSFSAVHEESSSNIQLSIVVFSPKNTNHAVLSCASFSVTAHIVSVS
jgi:hypothetical protein